MTIIGDVLLPQIIAYLINIASGERSAAIAETRAKKLKQTLEETEDLRKALASTSSIRDEIRGACKVLARDRKLFGVRDHEIPLWQLLGDDAFQANLTEWLMAGAIEEGNAVKNRLLETMERALVSGGASSEEISHFTTSYFESVDKAIYAHPVLAHWRQQLSLDYLREQVTVLRELAEEAAGIYPRAKQEEVLDRYCKNALSSWDIIDLSNLPEGDVQITTQQLLLRLLYMPLRIEVEQSQFGEDDDAALTRLEQQRKARRHREAGHLFPDDVREAAFRFSEKRRSPIGERLGVSRRLVVLGDPGGGKTTMLRWMATAYLLKHKGDAAFKQIPDTDTLPEQPWIPVLIRCRELGEVDLCRCFIDFLTQHLNKTELLPNEASIMRAVILDRIAKGEALLLVDGLDEITNPHVRMQFCQELERTAARYPNAPIVVTSRIVGYRDMPYRMGAGFAHGVIAELNQEDKDLFAQRWVEVTEQHQPPPEKAKRIQELIEALHSSDRIERLTGNPMLLTTLALVKRKVGKLPNRRTKLYAEAVSVLLNWNPRLYQTIEEDEAIPQLEYLAYEMCRRGVQQLTDDEILDLLDSLRLEYPRIRAVRTREPGEFLKHLEQRSSILIRSGSAWQKNSPSEKPVWEFRHLTFQEYLAARALLDGRYPARGKPRSLAEQVSPLAGAMEAMQSRRLQQGSDDEVDVSESWREALRLLVADCKDDDVDDVLIAILNPMNGEDAAKTTRPRAVLAALCLADEPNVSEETATLVLKAFAAVTTRADGDGVISTSLNRAAMEVAGSMWSSQLKRALIDEFSNRPTETRWCPGALWGRAEIQLCDDSVLDSKEFCAGLVRRLQSGDRVEVISAGLALMTAAYEGRLRFMEILSESLLAILYQTDLPVRNAAAWALGWMSKGPALGQVRDSGPNTVWIAKDCEVKQVSEIFDATPLNETATRRWLAVILGYSGDPQAMPPLLRGLSDQDVDVRCVVIEALARLGDKQAVDPLLAMLDDQDAVVRMAVVEALARLGDKQAVEPLLVMLDDQDVPVRIAVIKALGQLGDKQAVEPLLAMLDDQDVPVRIAIVKALGQLGDKLAVQPLLTKLDDQDNAARMVVIEVLGQLGDKQAVEPLLAKLDGQDSSVRRPVIEALGRLGDKQAVEPLLANLDDQDSSVRWAVSEALGRLGDKQAVEPLLAKLDDLEADVRAVAAIALRTLGEPEGSAALTRFLESKEVEIRQAIVHAYARSKERTDQLLLSRDLDARPPWIDPQKTLYDGRVSKAARQLNIPPEQVRSRFEVIAGELKLKLDWEL